MLFKQVGPMGYDRNFTYVIGNNGKAFIVDPAGDAEKIEQAAKDYKIIYIINTHGHGDHTQLNDYFLKKGAKLIDKTFELEGIKVEMIQTPGHTKDSKCILINKTKLVTGDTLFVGKVGGIFWKEGAEHEYESLKKLMKLPDNIEVWPGHDYGIKPHSTIKEEKKNNPFIKCKTFKEFIHLAMNWQEYKKEHNID